MRFMFVHPSFFDHPAFAPPAFDDPAFVHPAKSKRRRAARRSSGSAVFVEPDTLKCAITSDVRKAEYRRALPRTPRNTKDLICRIAYHEAGHCVSYFCAGQPITRAWVDYTLAADGSLDIHGGYAETAGDSTGTCYAAGVAAERLAGYSRATDDVWLASDVSKFNTLRLKGGTQLSSFDEAIVVAQMRCRRMWSALESLAGVLFCNGAVSGADAERILRKYQHATV